MKENQNCARCCACCHPLPCERELNSCCDNGVRLMYEMGNTLSTDIDTLTDALGCRIVNPKLVRAIARIQDVASYLKKGGAQ